MSTHYCLSLVNYSESHTKRSSKNLDKKKKTENSSFNSSNKPYSAESTVLGEYGLYPSDYILVWRVYKDLNLVVMFAFQFLKDYLVYIVENNLLGCV